MTRFKLIATTCVFALAAPLVYATANSNTTVTAAGPKIVAKQWAAALKMRDGKTQSSLLCPDLQKKYLKQLQDSNWATGLSSPWVSKYSITYAGKQKNAWHFKIKYTNATGAGVFGNMIDDLEIIKSPASQPGWCIQKFKYLSAE